MTDEQRAELDDAVAYVAAMRRTAAELRELVAEIEELRAMITAYRGEKPPAVTVLH